VSNPLHAAWLTAASEAGYPQTPDVNGFRQEGFGRMDMTVAGGRRCSAANAYLRPAMQRPNLKVLTHALATRIVFGVGVPSGLEYVRGGSTHRVRVDRELILSAADQFTPAMKLSGVGAAAELRTHGIPVVHDLPGVGEKLAGSSGVLFPGGLQGADHPVFVHQSLESARSSRALAAAQRRLGASNHFETCGFIRSRPAYPIPTSSITFCPWPWRTTARPWRKSTAFKRTWARCGPKAVGGCAWHRPTPATSHASCSIT